VAEHATAKSPRKRVPAFSNPRGLLAVASTPGTPPTYPHMAATAEAAVSPSHPSHRPAGRPCRGGVGGEGRGVGGGGEGGGGGARPGRKKNERSKSLLRPGGLRLCFQRRLRLRSIRGPGPGGWWLVVCACVLLVFYDHMFALSALCSLFFALPLAYYLLLLPAILPCIQRGSGQVVGVVSDSRQKMGHRT
jgi:hypothetical protein